MGHRAHRRSVLGVLVAVAALAAPPAAALPRRDAAPAAPAAAPVPAPAAAFVSGELVVRYRPGTGAAERAALRDRIDATLERRLPVGRAELVRLRPGEPVAAAEARADRRPEVLDAQPNYLYRAGATPNDPGFGELWGLHNTGQTVDGSAGTADADIDAPEAWDLTTGSPATIAAVTDTGVAYDHPDLAANVYLNPGESGGGRETNGIDDDRNGFVDDFRGYDFCGHQTPSAPGNQLCGTRDNDPADLHRHGTHVAGTIGARGGNGTGVAGVNWQVQVMALRVLDATGTGTSANLIDAIAYARGNGARIVNASLSGPGNDPALAAAIAAASRVLFVASAGNGGVDGVGDDNDSPTQEQYPCNDPAANLVCTAATDQNDGLAAFSNFGATSVDLGAPGTKILSTALGGAYAYQQGTSMAAPHVAGVLALLASQCPAAPVAYLRGALLAGVEAKPALAGKTVTGGRLNARRAIESAQTQDGAAPAAFDLTGPADGAVSAGATPALGWSASSDADCGLTKYQLFVDGALNRDGIPAAATSTTPAAALADGLHTWFVRAVDGAGKVTQSGSTRGFRIDTAGPAPFDLVAPASGSAFAGAAPALSWSPSSDAGSGLASYRLFIDGALNRDGISAGTTSAAPAAPLADGLHTWFARALDAAGNATQSASTRTLRIDTAPPAAFDLAAPAPGAFLARRRPVLSWRASSDAGSGLASYRLFVDGALNRDGLHAGVTSAAPAAALRDGLHTWFVRALDAVGNATRSASIRGLRIDTREPRARLAAGARQPLAEALRRGIAASCAAGEPAVCELTATIGRAQAARLGIAARKAARAVVVGRAKVRLTGSGRRAARVRLSRAARRALAAARRPPRLGALRVALTARVTDRAGNAATARRRLALEP